MRVLIALEHHFKQTPDGAVWTQVAYAYPFWASYLSSFAKVQVIARVQHMQSVSSDWLRADGAHVSFAALPEYVGPWQYLRRASEITRILQRAFRVGDAVILRVPSTIGTAWMALLNRPDYPYAVQVVGDPNDMFAPGVVTHPLRVFWRSWFTRQLKQQCAGAVAAVYVTNTYLQQRYPCPAYMTSFSDVELTEDAFVKVPRVPRRTVSPMRLVTIASLAQLYKAPDVLIQAVGLCSAQDVEVELDIVGDGKYRSLLEAQTRELGLEGQVHFLGQLTAGADVRAQLDVADLFVLPSRAEGLPRAMLEAMARGLPCIGSTVGGIPDLLEPEDMVPPGDADALARKIREILFDSQRMTQMSERNLARANAYRSEELAPKQNAFYRYVRERTQDWLGQHQ